VTAGAVRTLAWREVWARRLAAHRLDRPSPRAGLVEVVSAVGGVHAQVMASAELAIALRVEGATRRDVRAELWERRSLVKTYGLRGTVHLFPADELPLWLAAMRASRRAGGEALAPDARTRAVIEAIAEALDGRCLTREELGEEVGRRAGAWALEPGLPAFGGAWPVWGAMIGPAAAAGVLCFGPNRGNRVTFVRPDQWLAGRAEVEVDGEAALREVLRRYLAAYGPARPADFARWFRMDGRAAADLVRGLAGELEEVDVEGWRAWRLAGDEAAPVDVTGDSVRLLPHFDGYVLACHPRERLVPPPVRSRLDEATVPAWVRRALAAGAVGTLPTLLVDGVVAGVWERRRERGRLEVRVEPVGPLSGRQRRALEREARRVGEILEAETTLEVGAVDVRPHL
jgi:hypothetical protein